MESIDVYNLISKYLEPKTIIKLSHASKFCFKNRHKLTLYNKNTLNKYSNLKIIKNYDFKFFNMENTFINPIEWEDICNCCNIKTIYNLNLYTLTYPINLKTVSININDNNWDKNSFPKLPTSVTKIIFMFNTKETILFSLLCLHGGWYDLVSNENHMKEIIFDIRESAKYHNYVAKYQNHSIIMNKNYLSNEYAKKNPEKTLVFKNDFKFTFLYNLDPLINFDVHNKELIVQYNELLKKYYFLDKIL